MNFVLKKQTVFQIITMFVSLVLIIFAYDYIVGAGTVFKGKIQGEIIRAKVIRITDEGYENNSGNPQQLTVNFTAQAQNTTLRGKTINVIQEIDRSYVFSPRQVRQGDIILVESYTESNETHYYFGDFVRITPLIILAVLFCILVLVFSRSQGFKTLVSLGLTCLAVFSVLLPAILGGKNIYLWTVIVCLYITVMTLTIVSGYSKKTLCSCIGCMCGVACAGLITLITGNFLNMTGLLEEESIYLYQLYPDNPIDLKAIIFSMITIGALGAVMDVSMSISSSLYELRLKSPSIAPKELMRSGFTIGRDMMGTMVNTLVLAYIGGDLTCILLLVSYNANIEQVINKEIIIAELLQALAGSMGMLLTLPLTSAVCAAIYYGRSKINAPDKNE